MIKATLQSNGHVHQNPSVSSSQQNSGFDSHHNQGTGRKATASQHSHLAPVPGPGTSRLYYGCILGSAIN